MNRIRIRNGYSDDSCKNLFRFNRIKNDSICLNITKKIENEKIITVVLLLIKFAFLKNKEFGKIRRSQVTTNRFLYYHLKINYFL